MARVRLAEDYVRYMFSLASWLSQWILARKETADMSSKIADLACEGKLKVTELEFILREAAKFHHNNSQDEYNDYRAEKAVTEYLMTADFARSILQNRHKVAVEVQCKYTVNHLNSSKISEKHDDLGKKRFDIVVGDKLAPSALLELKIGVVNISKLVKDVEKILNTIGLMNKRKQPLLGALVFETFINGKGRVAAQDFRNEYASIFSAISADLQSYVTSNWPGVKVTTYQASESVFDAEFDQGNVIERDGSGSFISFAIMEVAPPSIQQTTPIGVI